MNNREISSQLQKLNDLIAKTGLMSSVDLELQSHWAKYLCVLTAGFLENAIKELYMDYVRRSARSAPLAKYASDRISRVTNPNAETFLQITYNFDKSWGHSLETFLDVDGRADALNSIMKHRNKIAHGRNSDITIVRLKEYLKRALDVLDHLETQCL